MPTPPLPTASALDTARVLMGVFLPAVAEGPVIRRPWAVGLAARLAHLEAQIVAVHPVRDRRAHPRAGAARRPALREDLPRQFF